LGVVGQHHTAQDVGAWRGVIDRLVNEGDQGSASLPRATQDRGEAVG
jgi:hypothetical protein